MSDLDAWMGDRFPLATLQSLNTAADTARLVADKPTSIGVVRAGVPLLEQSVRIEPLGRPVYVPSGGGITAMADALVLGHKDHPTIPDTDLRTGDRFSVGAVAYEVVAVTPGLPGSLQAFARVRS